MKIDKNILILQDLQNNKNTKSNIQRIEEQIIISNSNKRLNIQKSYETTTQTNEDSLRYKYVPDKNEVGKLFKQSEDRTIAFKKMIEKLIYNQAVKNLYALGVDIDFEYNEMTSNTDSINNSHIEVDDELRSKAKQLISEDGYYGVKQTSERILSFAKALSQGNLEKIELLKSAVQEGFNKAEKAWGGKLPQISQDTYNAVITGFDKWVSEQNS